jgi:hypothetical protein
MRANELAAIEARLAAATGDRWRPGSDPDGVPVVYVGFPDGREDVLRITRERVPASIGDIDFIGHARRDLERLIGAVRGVADLADAELDQIEARLAGASPAPWRVFLEADGGIGGSNVISVSDGDDEPDLYIWRDGKLASDGDFEFIAAARQDIPDLIAEVRRPCGNG